MLLGPYTLKEHKAREAVVNAAKQGWVNRTCEILGIAVPERAVPEETPDETPSRYGGGSQAGASLSRRRSRSTLLGLGARPTVDPTKPVRGSTLC